MAADLANGHWWHALFACANGAILAYAILRFVGLRASVEDTLLAYREWTRPMREAPAVHLPEPVSSRSEPITKSAAGE